MYKRWCCLTLEQSHLPNNFWSYEPVATKEAGEPGRGRCSYCSPSKWRLSYVVRQLRTYSEFISSVAQKISSAIGKLLWSSCFPIKSFFFFLLIYLDVGLYILSAVENWYLRIYLCCKYEVHFVMLKTSVRTWLASMWHSFSLALPTKWWCHCKAI